jgi:excisionase family DNA binding protein
MAPGVQARPLLTIEETARRLRVSTKTVRRLIGRGDLPAVRVRAVIRIDPDELDEAIRNWTVGDGSSADTPSFAVGRSSSDQPSAERDGTSPTPDEAVEPAQLAAGEGR